MHIDESANVPFFLYNVNIKHFHFLEYHINYVFSKCEVNFIWILTQQKVDLIADV